MMSVIEGKCSPIVSVDLDHLGSLFLVLVTFIIIVATVSSLGYKKKVSFLIRVRVTQYLSRQVFFFFFLAGVIFVISVFRPWEVATVAAADSVLYFVLDNMFCSSL